MTGNILEIGPYCLFKCVYPESTTWLRMDMPNPPPGSPSSVSKEAIPSIGRELQNGGYDLIVYFPRGRARAPAVHLDPRRWEETLISWKWYACHRSALRLLDLAGRTPLAVLDMEDSAGLSPLNIPLLDRCRAYFKREFPLRPDELVGRPGTARARYPRRPALLSVERYAKLRPISLGLPAKRIAAAPAAPQEKTTDIFFAGTNVRNTVRQAGSAQLLSLPGVRLDIRLSRSFSFPDYMTRCAQAWLCWSPEGRGRDCFRHYEAAVCRSVPVINRAPVIRHRPLEDGVQAIYYDPGGDDLLRVVTSALKDKQRLRRMAEAARAHVLRHHTHEAMCRYILDEVFQ